MAVRTSGGRFFTGLALFGFMFTVAGCQSSGNGLLGVGDKQGPTQAEAQAEGKVLASELTAYCPNLTLREGTAYYNAYAAGGQDDQAKLIYQAAITGVTRACTRANGMLTMNVAAAGRMVPGPLGKAGTITMPIRVAVTLGDQALYSQLHQYKVQVGDTSTATQFVFNDPNVTVPEPSARNYQVFVGFDEGPPKAAPKPARVAKKVVKKKPAPAQPEPAQTSISDIPR
jgi:hypothetical protein